MVNVTCALSFGVMLCYAQRRQTMPVAICWLRRMALQRLLSITLEIWLVEVIAAAGLVMLQTPGVGLFYSGLLRRKNALAMIFMSVAIYCVVSVEWFLWGYSLAFDTSSNNGFIGNVKHFGFIDVLDQPSGGNPRIPELLYAFYQSMFACVTPAIAFGAIAERGRIGPTLLLVFCWSTIVYNPIAFWVWCPTGWAASGGTLDFAGGGPVHMCSGMSALAISMYLGKRRGYGTEKLAYKPQNVTYVILGTVFLWFGWFGFNGGSALSANLRAVQACIVTNISASMGGLAWCLLDFRYDRKFSAIGLCSGIISGLVAITPASGYVGTPAALAFGAVAGVGCNLATGLKWLIGADDCLDIFAVHAVGGLIGNIMTGFFADSRVAGFDGVTVIPGGWINHNYKQMGWQLASSCAIFLWASTLTYLLCFVIDHIPGLHLRASTEDEIAGIDSRQMGEHAYDYVYLKSELDAQLDEEEEIVLDVPIIEKVEGRHAGTAPVSLRGSPNPAASFKSSPVLNTSAHASPDLGVEMHSRPITSIDNC